MWKKKGEENIFSDSKWCLRFGYGAENKICSIKETRAYCFILFSLEHFVKYYVFTKKEKKILSLKYRNDVLYMGNKQKVSDV